MSGKTRSYRSDLFSTPAGANDAAAQATRDALSHKPLEGVEIFTVRVLSKPLPLQPYMASAVLGSATPEPLPPQTPGEQAASVASADAAELEARKEEMLKLIGANEGDYGVEAQLESIYEQVKEAEAAQERDTRITNLIDPAAAPTNRFFFKGRIEMEGQDTSKTLTNFHNILPDPCNLPLSYEPDVVIRILTMYPTFVSKVGYTGKQPSVGELVEVTMQQGDFAQNGQYNVFNTLTEASDGTAHESSQDLASGSECSNLAVLFQDFGADTEVGFSGPELGGSAAAGGPPGQNAATDLEIKITAELAPATSGTTIKGVGAPQVKAIAEAEIALWGGKKETDPTMLSTLKKYWDNLGWASDAWTPASVPWSAAFISYIASKADPSFPKSAAHRKYATSGFDGRQAGQKWQTFSLISEKIEVKIGDILVKPRTGSWGNTHGDIVYKIENSIAYLAGGNVGDTGKSVGQIKLAPGNLVGKDTGFGAGVYIIIVKKMK